jgi:3-deoxy-manno-octulosonate cytidylyltransferase (CMP-KDO synthetase)
MPALIVIPARLKASRLPDKPLAVVGDAPMIVQVWRRAVAAHAGPVVVAAGDQAIADAVTSAGGSAIMTDADLPSGSDRVHAAAEAFDPAGTYDVVVNVQGDLPTLDPALVAASITPLADSAVDIATVVARITDVEELSDPAVVKAAVSLPANGRVGPALYFSRNPIPAGPGDHYHHIGIYAFRRAALRRFVTLKPTVLEQREKLEQLRALENGMRMAAALVDTVPLGVDTPADLERARRLFKPL